MALQKLTYSCKEFCAFHGISRTLLYVLLKSGKGPATMLIGRRRMISIEAAKEWRDRMSIQLNDTGSKKS